MKNSTEVIAWGADESGQFGLGAAKSEKSYCSPRFYTFNVNIIQISCGESHAAFITEEGRIFTMGSNSDGRLGIGEDSIIISTTPCLLSSVEHLRGVMISCGNEHTAAIFDNGELYTWGKALHGALGIAVNTVQWAPVKVKFNGPEPSIKYVSCGVRHTGVIDIKGNVYMFGSGSEGQLGTGKRQVERLPVLIKDLPYAVKAVACGTSHTLILTSTGKVLATGDNAQGQLGRNNRVDSLSFVIIEAISTKCMMKIAAGDFSACLDILGEVYIWGSGFFGESLIPTVVKGFAKPIKHFDIGKSFGIFVDRVNVIYSWGLNSNGELGLNNYDSKLTPTIITDINDKNIFDLSCGPSYTIALSGEEVKSKDASLIELGRSGSNSTHVNPNRMSKVNAQNANCDELRREVENMEDRVIALKNEKHKRVLQKSDEHILLLNSERKLQGEVKEMEILIKSKRNEIETLDRGITEVKSLYKSLTVDQTSIPKQFTKEREEMIEKLKRQKEYIEECRNRNSRIAMIQKQTHEELENTVKDLNEELKSYDKDIENQYQRAKSMHLNLRDTEDKIERKEEEYKKLIEELKYNNEILIREREKYKENKRSKEILSLEESLNNKQKLNKDLLNILDGKQIELEEVKDKVNSYKRLTERLEERNADLKKRIEELEANNKRLLMNLNLLLYDKANEYKERTMNALNIRQRRTLTQEGLSKMAEMIPKDKVEYGGSNFELVKRLDEYSSPKKEESSRREKVKEWHARKRPMSNIEQQIAESKERLMQIFNSPPEKLSLSEINIPLTTRHDRNTPHNFPILQSLRLKH